MGSAAPADPPPEGARTLWLWVLAAAALWWAGVFVELLAVGGVLCAAAAFAFAVRDRRGLPLLVTLLIMPPTVIAAAAAVDYLRGEARLLAARSAHITLHNVDRETRCQHTSDPDGTWVRQGPHNATLRALSGLFGPMAGAYVGPYPTDAQIRIALADGAPPALDGTSLTLGETAVDLHPELLRTLRRTARRGAEIRGAVWQGEVAIVEVQPAAEQANRYGGAGPKPRSAVVLVDVDSGRVLAYLGAIARLRGSLPVPWS